LGNLPHGWQTERKSLIAQRMSGDGSTRVTRQKDLPHVSRLINHLGMLRGPAAVAVVSLLCSGCFLGQKKPSHAAHAPDTPSGGLQRSGTSTSTSSQGTADDRALLARPDWICAIGDGPPSTKMRLSPLRDNSQDPARQAGPTWHWRHPGVEELAARSGARQVDFHAYLGDKDAIVAANAAIALARGGDAAGATHLAEAVRTRTIKLPMRCAAIESLASLDGEGITQTLSELLDEYGNSAGGNTSGYVTELHIELLRGLARHIDPAEDARLLAALRSASPEVRLAAVRAWGNGRHGTLPPEVVEMASDSDWRVRVAALEALSARQHPELLQHLTAALEDMDLQVRLAAIAALGRLDAGQAKATLAGLLKDRSESIRAEAVAALAHSGAEQSVLGAAGDEKWRVRLQVARALADIPVQEATAVALRLLDDPSAEVQREAVVAIAQWPIERGGPLLLEALGKPAFMTRQAATRALAAKWPPAIEFPAAKPPPQRAEVLAKLQLQFRRDFADRLRDQQVKQASATAPAGVAPAVLDRVQTLLRQGDFDALGRLGPELIDALEQLALERGQLLPASVYHDLLSPREPVFAALERLHSPELSQRRRAAEELLRTASEHPLRRLAIARLCDLVMAESDGLVWRSVLQITAGDASEPAVRLAYAAIGHASPEVRRRAAENLAAHPSSAHAKVLLPALEDDDRAVVLAAVRALGLTGHVDDTRPLAKLLAAGNEELQLETAAALVRLGDPAGKAALERLAYSRDFQTRTRVAAMMGELGHGEFAPILVRMLADTDAGVMRAALASLPKVAQRDIGQTPGAVTTSTNEQIRRWKEWDGK
jgi:HEAT repeat protein